LIRLIVTIKKLSGQIRRHLMDVFGCAIEAKPDDLGDKKKGRQTRSICYLEKKRQHFGCLLGKSLAIPNLNFIKH
jgi:hypothetical protein